ncbi:MAG: DUF6036 family nucleotidyltransferase [Eggerthellaceae bacterium]
MEKVDLIDTLLGIDEEVSLDLGEADVKPCVVVVGGAAFILRDLTHRVATHDIDVLQMDASVRDILANYPQVNGAVVAYQDSIPYNFEDRLVELDIGASAVKFVTPSTEDLVVMKLYAGRPNDLQDIESVVADNALDWELLEHLVFDEDEAKAATNIERRYREMVDAYKRLKEKWLK